MSFPTADLHRTPLTLTLQELGKKYKALRWMRPLGPLTACIIGLCSVYIGHVDNYGIRIIGTIPAGECLAVAVWH